MVSCIAVDIGAGSGRVLNCDIKGGILLLNEIHRFENEASVTNGHLRWDINSLFNEVCVGIKKTNGKYIDSIGIDTWGVDFVLLDNNDEPLELPVAYRDSRTKGMMELLFKKMDKEIIYNKTGIQFMEFNTIFQFMYLKQTKSILLDKAKTFLMIPDYLNFKLTGKKSNEFTNMTTTQMVDTKSKSWDTDIINTLEINKDLFLDSNKPGDFIGKSNINQIPVYSVASHDTGSAIASTPATGDDWLYISSGTWCLMGVESKIPIKTKKAFEYNFTNEGGVYDTYRVLKNIMGLWVIRGIKKSLNIEYSYRELIDAGKQSKPFKHYLLLNDSRFLNPKSMCQAIDDFCRDTGQEPPKTVGEYIRCAEEGLAFLYKEVLMELREIYQKPLNKIHILGGGTRDELMCQLTADATGLTTYAGPTEATAIGNIIVQAIAIGHFSNIEEARKSVFNSFKIKTYISENQKEWDMQYKKYITIKERL